MAYFISCSGAKTCLTRAETFPSSLESIKSFSDLHDAREELISLLGINLDWTNTLHAYKLWDGRQVEIKLREWVRENQHYFPNYGFTNSQDDHPITHYIKDFCVRH